MTTLHLHIFWLSLIFRSSKNTDVKKETHAFTKYFRERKWLICPSETCPDDWSIYFRQNLTFDTFQDFHNAVCWLVIPSTWCQNEITNISFSWCFQRKFWQISISFASHLYWVLNFVSSHFRLGINLFSHFAAKRFYTKLWFSHEITTYEWGYWRISSRSDRDLYRDGGRFSKSRRYGFTESLTDIIKVRIGALWSCSPVWCFHWIISRAEFLFMTSLLFAWCIVRRSISVSISELMTKNLDVIDLIFSRVIWIQSLTTFVFEYLDAVSSIISMTLIFVENNSDVDLRTYFEIKFLLNKCSSTLLNPFSLILSWRSVVMTMDCMERSYRHSELQIDESRSWSKPVARSVINNASWYGEKTTSQDMTSEVSRMDFMIDRDGGDTHTQVLSAARLTLVWKSASSHEDVMESILSAVSHRYMSQHS